MNNELIELLLDNRVINSSDHKKLLKIYKNENEITEVVYDLISDYFYDRIKEAKEDGELWTMKTN